MTETCRCEHAVYCPVHPERCPPESAPRYVMVRSGPSWVAIVGVPVVLLLLYTCTS